MSISKKFDKWLELYRAGGIEAIRSEIPELQGLESSRYFEGIVLVDDSERNEGINLEYEARAPKLFPNVRKEIIKRDVVGEHNVFGSSVKNKGMENEMYNIKLAFYSCRLQVNLRLTR